MRRLVRVLRECMNDWHEWHAFLWGLLMPTVFWPVVLWQDNLLWPAGIRNDLHYAWCGCLARWVVLAWLLPRLELVRLLLGALR